MYFDFEGRHFDTPTVESAMSWRERSLLSLFAHLLAAGLILVGPRLPFVRDAAARQAERLAEMVAEQQLALRQDTSDEPRFVFVQPPVDPPPAEPPPQVDLSDVDSIAVSPLQAETPVNDLPNAEGNSPERVLADDPSVGLDPATEPGAEDVSTALDPGGPADDVTDGAAPDPPDTSPDDADGLSNPFARRGDSPRETPLDAPPGRILDEARRRLDTVARSDTFHNLGGRTDQFGPQIQFDTKGVEFGPWIRRFVAQIRRNWFIPYAAMSMSGNVVVTFNVHKDGSVTELTVQRPSDVAAFTNSAFNALRSSNPTQPLPPEYPDDQAFFTVTFYFNEVPPGR